MLKYIWDWLKAERMQTLGTTIKSSSNLTQNSRSKMNHLPAFLFPGESFLPGNLLRRPST